MYRITLEINSSIYEHIMFFLENLPKNLVNIKQEREIKIKKPIEKSIVSKMKNLQGVGKELYQDIDSDIYIKELRSEW
ncbi:hypothetical protein MNB_SV-13-1392 [hydrothermal vent metagenome]|uniref:Uncharacterized protein n=1 Tax=hydrothermal vent metagenome TaxID=652676 RepID=A0A1W1CMK2_9ZZZZ